MDPKSQSYGNAFKSAVLAGFEENYAKNITSNMPAWLMEKVGRYRASDMLEKAERNLNYILDLPTRVQAMGAFGPIFQKIIVKQSKKLKNGKTVKRNVTKKVPVYVEAGKLLEIKQKTSHFVAERIGRKQYGADPEEAPPLSSIVHMTQIIINPPAKV